MRQKLLDELRLRAKLAGLRPHESPLQRAVRLLRKCEWAPVTDQIYYTPSCPVCEAFPDKGHWDDCELKAFLDEQGGL
jgi:hypothetical protein